ncbi:DUF4230 domain-containing protein [Sphingomonas naphthae]|uniref:DUF4230 domain-containing protein n=1 Tax=Sphingomonas naphthae TaxID=1813468 RepID=A0ABY7TNI0_9SPHN|nr:DUF4230 domain-containing protein [Sphingomonas naphthae]WCT74791.1 DUF4230 domain-containing protein [Sphingomonas naphthae]
MIRPAARWAAGVLAALLLIALAAWIAIGVVRKAAAPDPTVIATASLESMREQNRLVPFQARYVAVVTATQRRFGLSAEKTLILPGTVRYELDLAAIRPRDVAWDAGSRTLSVSLPDIQLSGPAVDLGGMKEYGGGGLLTRFTDASTVLTDAARKAGQAELLNQARAPVPMRLAREAARRAVVQNFAMPLRAAGLDATVRVRFASEADFEPMDRSAEPGEVYRNGA